MAVERTSHYAIPPPNRRSSSRSSISARAEGAVEQALLYAFKSGVPFVVLTDGKTWSFYLPAEPGDYDERRVYKLDLYERSPDEAAEKFRQYLANECVVSGESLRAARTEYHNLNRRSQAKAAIPEAWRELVQKRDSSLIEILAGAVESKVGFRPDTGDVVEFSAVRLRQGSPRSRSLSHRDSLRRCGPPRGKTQSRRENNSPNADQQPRRRRPRVDAGQRRNRS